MAQKDKNTYVKCSYCHGSGQVTVWNKQKKTYETVTCTVCKGKGGVHI